MTISRPSEPDQGRELIGLELARRRHRAGQLAPLSVAMQAAGLQMGAPLPLYNLDRDAALGPNFLRSARMVGWRYPIVGGEVPGLAHLSANAKGYEGLTQGVVPQRLMQGAVLAEQVLGPADEAYEARLLQIPALRIYALWLAGPDNRFVVLTDGLMGQPPLAVIDNLSPVIQGAAAAGSAPPRAPGVEGPIN